MKLKQLFLSILAGAAVFFSCTPEEPISTLADFNIDKSYVGFVTEGGTVKTFVEAATAWSIDVTTIPDWLTISPTGGGVGSTTVLFTVGANDGDQRSQEIKVKIGNETQIITVSQDGNEPAVLTIADIIKMAPGLAAGTIPEQTVIVKGIVCMIKEISTQYGNATYFLSDDGTYSGSYNADGTGNANWFEVYRGYWFDGEKFTKGDEFAVGDEITVKGTLMSYYGTPETAQNASEVIAHTPSLIDVAPFDFEKLPAIDTVFNMVVTAKESPLLVTSDADWLVIESVNADGSYKLHAAENPRTAERSANISIKGPTALKSFAITQKGAPVTGSSVSDIIKMEDKSQVQTLPTTVVVALTTKGAVLSDGTKAIYAFGDKAAALKVGDGVKMSATKTTYNGVPELTDITEVFVDSQGNPVEYPKAKDITPEATTYAATEAEFVKLNGTLKVSGNYYNIELDGVDTKTKQGSIVYPIDALNAKSFDGKKITVTGYYNGLSGKGVYLNVIAVKIEEYADNPKGSVTNPYTASEIAALVLAGTAPTEDVYIKGIVSAILYDFAAKQGTGTFWISDDGKAYGISEDKKKTTEPTKDFEVYGVYTFGNKAWVEGGVQVEVGDEVVVCGKTTLYSGVAETASKKAWIHSINGATSADNGVGNTKFPFNVAGAENFIDQMEAAKAAAKAAGDPEPVFPNVCVKGKVSAILYPFAAAQGTTTFWISDDGKAYGISADKKSTSQPKKDFECYGVYDFGNKPWTEGGIQLAEGDDVIVKGQLTLYKTTYETSSKKAWLYSVNGNTGVN